MSWENLRTEVVEMFERLSRDQELHASFSIEKALSCRLYQQRIDVECESAYLLREEAKLKIPCPSPRGGRPPVSRGNIPEIARLSLLEMAARRKAARLRERGGRR